MKAPWKRPKSVRFEDYQPKSQLIAERTPMTRAKFPVIDAHTHFGMRKPGERFERNYHTAAVMDALRGLGVTHCVNLTMFGRKDWERVHRKTCEGRTFISHCAPIDLTRLFEKQFPQWIRNEMRRYAEEGAVGFKIWKELGFSLKRPNGKLVALQDGELDCVWDAAQEAGLPLVLHVADPPAFFEKVDRTNERLEELRRYPFWRRYGQPYSFLDLMEQMERLLQRRPGNQFLIAHFCSWPSNLDFVEQLLERYANLYTDCAATLSELGRQPRRFRRFMEKFPDRVLFGTDNFCASNPPHLPYFRFFETEDEYFPYGDTLEHGRWRIYGCALPDRILRKLYYENAARFFRLDGEEWNKP